ncbi:MAG: threonylcarbamoyl-AMP synthase [Xanthomonadales bacterium]|nr:threonylcarbamoyl-AMP synthase [Xanthomonadales bacterium]
MARSVDLDAAERLLRAGEVVAIPTETVYGLAADARNAGALARVFALKRRPLGNPLIVHLPDATVAPDWAHGTGDPAVAALLARFWPGPLTVVLPARPTVLPLVTAGSGQVALRVPAHPLARTLLARLDGALCAPSANRSGYVSPTSAAHVLADYPDHDLAVLDGGDCPGGIESTIVRPVGDTLQILRPGAIDLATLRNHWPGSVQATDPGALPVPGSSPRHYAPRTPVLLIERDRLVEAGPSDAVLAISPAPTGLHAAELRTLPDDPAGYARALYATLRALDRGGHGRLLVQRPPDADAWLAIANRLARAAHPESAR